jgi:CBS domain containing-hemolysin-like protein
MMASHHVTFYEFLQVFLGVALFKSIEFATVLNVHAAQDKHRRSRLNTALGSRSDLNLLRSASFGINITYILHVASGSSVVRINLETIAAAFGAPQGTSLGNR